jgi:membrane fusion protein (multidrug efflux system)
MRKSIINTFLLLSYVIVSLLSSCNTAEEKIDEHKTQETKEAVVPVAIEIFPLQKGTLSTSYKIPGELIAFQQVDLYAKVSSFIKKLYVDVGSEVSMGQLLAVMEAPELNSQLSGAESRLHVQEAVYTASKANYDRLLETSKTPGTISPNDLDQAAAKKNADFAQLAAASAAHKEIAETKKYLEIRAPFNGIITARNVNTGAIVGPAGKGSELPLFTLQEQKKLRLIISVPEAVTSYLSKQVPVTFTVKGLPNEKFTANINRMAGALDLKLRSERVEMDVTNTNKRLMPGMVAEVSLPASTLDSTFIIPKTAIVNSTEKIFVIRLSNGKAVWVAVKNGREADDKVEIYGNLAAGDSLVTTASEEIRDGSFIKNVIMKKN